MNNKTSNIKTFSDLNKKSSAIIPFLSHDKKEFVSRQKINIDDCGKKLGDNHTIDIRKARVFYYDNLSKNTFN